MQSSVNDVDGSQALKTGEISRRLILDEDVFELEAYGRDKQELHDEGKRLLDKGFTGVGLKCIREYVVDETGVEGVYGLWVR